MTRILAGSESPDGFSSSFPSRLLGSPARLGASKQREQAEWPEKDSRVLPALVVNAIRKPGFAVGRVFLFCFQDFGLVEQFAVETQDFFIFTIHGRRA